MKKIVADENIPFAKELFSHLGDVHLVPGRHMSSADVQDAHIVLVRSVTPVNAQLLANSSVEFVGTCTIGVDHLDQAYMEKNNITFHSAPGCNAHGVVQYALSAIAKTDRLDTRYKVAIIGCGNVGGRLYKALSGMGFDCVGIDPFKTCDDIPHLASLDAIYDADIICMHTPRTRDGSHPTESLLRYTHFARMKPGTLLLNAGRGECIDNPDLLRYLQTHDDLDVVLDVWANEPAMSAELFPHVVMGTPHIAGYSYEGRVNGSTMIFEALASYLGMSRTEITQHLTDLRTQHFGPIQPLVSTSLRDAILTTYDVHNDSTKLSDVLADLPGSFDMLRKTYPKRREFSHYHVTLPTNALNRFNEHALSALGFHSGGNGTNE